MGGSSGTFFVFENLLAAGARDGIGLSNTRARLQQQYGARHTFALSSSGDGGTVVSLEIPA